MLIVVLRADISTQRYEIAAVHMLLAHGSFSLDEAGLSFSLKTSRFAFLP